MKHKIKNLHFIGIGGIGMSGIAEILINLGFSVSGSDLSENANVLRLRKLGATIHKGHEEENIGDADCVVHSSAVFRENPEIRAALTRNIPVVPRAEMLAELMRLKQGIAIAGTHGKTTTTSLVATLLAEADLDPTVVNGGILNAFGSNARMGDGEFIVAEADESDGTFLKLEPVINVVTNIDPEHLEHYGDFNALKDAFLQFIRKIPFYGLAVLCMDHPEVRALLPKLSDRRVVTYGLSDEADYRALELTQEGKVTEFEVLYRDPTSRDTTSLGRMRSNLPGEHNVLNTLAAIAVARELDIPWKRIVSAIGRFEGVQRRFDLQMETDNRVVIDDYAHHPVEIRAALAAARAGFMDRPRVVAIFQPHRFSRVRDLFDDFCAAFAQSDLVLVDRIYPAGEAPLPELGRETGQAALVECIVRQSATEAAPLDLDGARWRETLEKVLEPGDVVVFLGAGSVSQRAREFAAKDAWQ